MEILTVTARIALALVTLGFILFEILTGGL